MYLSGTCEFCGQVLALDNEVDNIKEANEAAKMICRCREAMEYQARQRSLESGLERIEELFGERCEEYGFNPVSEETVARLKENLRVCAEGGFRKVTVSLEDGSTAVLKFDDIAEIERKKSSKVKLSGKV